MRKRAERARIDSDSALFLELTYLGEFVIKMLTLELLAAIEDDRTQTRYALEFRLVRADSLGDWAKVLDELLVGTGSQHLLPAGRVSHRALNQQFGPGDQAWQRRAYDLLARANLIVDDEADVQMTRRQSVRTWVQQFVWMRNKTKGHGAPQLATLSQLCGPLQESLDLIIEFAPAFGRTWATLMRTMSGRYRANCFGGDRDEFQGLDAADQNIPNGVYVYLDQPRRVGLLYADLDLGDYFLPNGAYRGGKFDVISYITAARRSEDGTRWAIAVEARPDSETTARSTMELVGDTFSSAPPPRSGYITRPSLESEVRGLLVDDRHPVITLQGRGGVGKTSLALEVLHSLAPTGEFFAIVWFSARDVDLESEGPRVVRPDVLTLEDMAKDFAELMGAETDGGSKDALEYLANCLSGKANVGPFIFVFDNFETLLDQPGVYAWVSNTIRLPNKALITTRSRDFKADFPVEIRGMERAEFAELVHDSSIRLGIQKYVDAAYEQELYEHSAGHPYIAKVVLGEVSHKQSRVGLDNLVGTRDSMLDALFERSFGALSPAAQRVFLTLCSWKSFVPRIGLEGAIMRPENERIDVDHAISELLQVSLIEENLYGEERSAFLSVPLVAAIFGKRKLVTSPSKAAIEVDRGLLQGFGAIKASEASLGLRPRVLRMVSELGKSTDADFRRGAISVLEHVGSVYSPAWLALAQHFLESGDRPEAIRATNRYLEDNPEDVDAWRILVSLYRTSGDVWAEMNARIQLSPLAETPFGELSSAVGRLNEILREGVLPSDKRVIVVAMRALMEQRHVGGDATDYSRLALLCLNLQDKKSARRWVTVGLAFDPQNEQCLALNRRL
jgi:tetratricopeptide (TPR) repeat protein